MKSIIKSLAIAQLVVFLLSQIQDVTVYQKDAEYWKCDNGRTYIPSPSKKRRRCDGRYVSYKKDVSVGNLIFPSNVKRALWGIEDSSLALTLAVFSGVYLLTERKRLK